MWMRPSSLASMPNSLMPWFEGFCWKSPQMSMPNAAYQLSWSSTGASPAALDWSSRAKNTSREPSTMMPTIRIG